jgi:hypothetical protein
LAMEMISSTGTTSWFFIPICIQLDWVVSWC